MRVCILLYMSARSHGRFKVLLTISNLLLMSMPEFKTRCEKFYFKKITSLLLKNFASFYIHIIIYEFFIHTYRYFNVLGIICIFFIFNSFNCLYEEVYKKCDQYPWDLHFRQVFFNYNVAPVRWGWNNQISSLMTYFNKNKIFFCTALFWQLT